MKMKRFLTFYSGLLLCYFYFLVTGISVADQTPEKEKQVDVITIEKTISGNFRGEEENG